ncbi:hypothetical protein M5K25_006804 [Dendrobium thyrsiflorum]|uniref:Uncharacterized protein n=1 Tax=Dendrobium thyrsiflorum TaxID=117978 RepID=A0ABD0VDP5_DENTH
MGEGEGSSNALSMKVFLTYAFTVGILAIKWNNALLDLNNLQPNLNLLQFCTLPPWENIKIGPPTLSHQLPLLQSLKVMIAYLFLMTPFITIQAVLMCRGIGLEPLFTEEEGKNQRSSTQAFLAEMMYRIFKAQHRLCSLLKKISHWSTLPIELWILQSNTAEFLQLTSLRSFNNLGPIATAPRKRKKAPSDIIGGDRVPSGE